MAEEIIPQLLQLLQQAVQQLGNILSAAVSALEAFLAPIDPVIFIFSCFVIGIMLGLYFGKKKGFKDFFKMPSAHWRIRRGK